MNGLEKLLQKKAFKKLLARLYGIGASVVVLGALFKIEHLPAASFMLSAGLITEAIIFFFYAFDSEEEPVQVNAEVVNEDEYNDEHPSYRGKQRYGRAGGGSLALAKFDEMLEKADITPDMLQELGSGMRKLGETAENMNSMGNISAASKQYMKTIKSADESLGRLAKTYENTITKVTCNTVFKYKSIATSLSVIEEETRSYQQQMDSLNKNLSALNGLYKLQRKEAYNYLEDLTESAAESKRYRKQIKELNENLKALNQFYGNMRSTMKI
jgi:gliding motility-associated protein GldL